MKTLGTVPYVEERVFEIPQKYHSLAYSFTSANGFGGTVFALINEHFGDMVAEICKQQILEFFTPACEDGIHVAFKELIRKLDENTHAMRCGAIFSIVFIPKDVQHAYVAIIGNLPVIIWDKTGKINVDLGHDVKTNITERLAVEARGGKYKNGYIWNPNLSLPLGLQTSRAIGNSEMREILSREPKTYSIPLGPQSIVVIANSELFGPVCENTDTIDDTISARKRREDNVKKIIPYVCEPTKRTLDVEASIITWRGHGWENA